MKKLFVLLFLVVSYAAMAQDTIVLQTVEVNADAIRRNQAEQAMERKMDTALLKRLNTITMSQLLIQHSPVFIKTFGPGGLATASFRGTTASHTLVLWNGFQLNAPTLGQVDFSTIPVFMTEQVALKWGSGTSANSGGLGGIVNIETNQHFGEGWILDTGICAAAGVGRFVSGLAGEVEILEGEPLRAYLREYSALFSKVFSL